MRNRFRNLPGKFSGFSQAQTITILFFYVHKTEARYNMENLQCNGFTFNNQNVLNKTFFCNKNHHFKKWSKFGMGQARIE